MTQPYVRPDVASFLAASANVPPINALPLRAAREAIRTMGRDGDAPPEPMAVVRDLACPGGGGSIPLRLYDLRAGRGDGGPLVLFFHGGGFAFGDLDSHDSVCRTIAARTDLPVLAVDYRLAPETPFPGFADDAETVARWVASGPDELGFRPDGIVTCGDSAGGHLAILVAQRLGAEPAAIPVLAQWAIYPFVGGGHDWDSSRRFADGYMLTRAAMDWFDDFCGRPGDDPRYALLNGPVPPTPLLVQVAGLDPLRDQGLAYADKARDAGAHVVTIEAEGMIHGFVNLRGLLPSAQGDVDRFLTQALALLEYSWPAMDAGRDSGEKR